MQFSNKDPWQDTPRFKQIDWSMMTEHDDHGNRCIANVDLHLNVGKKVIDRFRLINAIN